jgi:hypothetical protein
MSGGDWNDARAKTKPNCFVASWIGLFSDFFGTQFHWG